MRTFKIEEFRMALTHVLQFEKPIFELEQQLETAYTRPWPGTRALMPLQAPAAEVRRLT